MGTPALPRLKSKAIHNLTRIREIIMMFLILPTRRRKMRRMSTKHAQIVSPNYPAKQVGMKSHQHPALCEAALNTLVQMIY